MSIWSIERNNTMKVFSKLFVGLKEDRSNDPTPLGFATPYEENAAGRKRQETVVSWLGGTRRRIIRDGLYTNEYEDVAPNTKIIDNVPRPGFKITDDIKRTYWGGGNVVWRVFDPYGFELEIQSRNLMAVIQSCGIDAGGLIPGNCIWGRSGKDNILLHESSDEYKDSVKAAETLKTPKQVGVADRVVGALYRRVDGSPGIFLGKVHVSRFMDSADMRSPWIMLPTGRKQMISASDHDLPPSEIFEAVLDIDPSKLMLSPSTSVKLYKKAPLVQRLNDAMTQEVTDAYLRTLKYSFASTTVDGTVGAVTLEPILNPEPMLVAWTAEKFNERIKDIRRTVEQYCNPLPGTMYRRRRFPIERLISGWHSNEVIALDGVLYGDICTVGEDSAIKPVDQEFDSFDIALPVTLGPGYANWNVGSSDLRLCMHKHAHHGWSGYMDRTREASFTDEREIEYTKLPVFADATAFYAYLEQLYNERQLFTVIIREAHV